MREPALLVVIGTLLLASCGPRDEFAHQTIAAYQADKSLREDVLQRCANYITSKTAFRTEADTNECRKAFEADQNVRLATHEARQTRAANAALSDAARQFEGH